MMSVSCYISFSGTWLPKHLLNVSHSFLFSIVSMIAVYPVSTASSMQEYASLLSTDAREQWEKCFDQEYIQPVLSVSGVVVDKNERDI